MAGLEEKRKNKWISKWEKKKKILLVTRECGFD